MRLLAAFLTASFCALTAVVFVPRAGLAADAGEACARASAQTQVLEVDPGGMATHVFAIEPALGAGEEGACRAHWTLEVPDGWSIVGPASGDVEAEAGQVHEVFATIIAPAAAPAGEYPVRIVVRGAGDPPGEPGDPSATEAEAAVRVKRVGRLLVQGGADDWRVLPGDPLNFSLVLSNQGNVEEEVLLGVSAPRSWRVRATPHNVTLAPGESATIEVATTVPPTHFPGTVYLEIEAAARETGATAHYSARVAVLPAEASTDGALHLQIPGVVRGYIGVDPKRGLTAAQGQVVTGGRFPSGIDLGAGLSVSDLSSPLSSGGMEMTAGSDTWSLRLGRVGTGLSRFVNVEASGVSVSYSPRIGEGSGAQVVLGTREGDGFAAAAAEIRTDQFRLKPLVASAIPITGSSEGFRLYGLEGAVGLTSRLTADFEAALSGREDNAPDFSDPGQRALGAGLSLRGTLGTIRLEAAQVGAEYEGTRTRLGTARRLGDPGTEGAALRARIPLGRVTLNPGVQRFRDFGDGEDAARTVNQLYVNTETALGRRHKLQLDASLTDTLRNPGERLGESLTGRLGVRLDGGFGPLTYGLGWSGSERFAANSGWSPARREFDVSVGISGLWARYVTGHEETSAGVDPFGRFELGLDTSIPFTPASLRLAGGRTARAGEDDVANRASVAIEAPLGADTAIGVQLSLSGEGDKDAGDPLADWTESVFSPDAERWIGVTVARRFALPLPWIKVKGRINGWVGLAGAGEAQDAAAGREGLGGIYVRAGLHTVRTGPDGRFRFPPFEPGVYDIYLENLPAELAPTVPMPMRVTVKAGEELEIEIPVARALVVRGGVFVDRDEDGARGEAEAGVAGVRMMLYRESGTGEAGAPLKEAFTGSDGTFTFGDIPPGRYRVRLDPEWLPERHVLLGAEEVVVELREGESPSALFPVAQVAKEVRFTYTEEE